MSNRSKRALTISAIAFAARDSRRGRFRADGRRDPRARREGGRGEGLSRRGFVAVFEKIDVTVEETGLAHYRRHTLTKILTDEGALAKAALRFDYDPASNFIDVESIRIFRKGGRRRDGRSRGASGISSRPPR